MLHTNSYTTSVNKKVIIVLDIIKKIVYAFQYYKKYVLREDILLYKQKKKLVF
jgi:hypothetical protein